MKRFATIIVAALLALTAAAAFALDIQEAKQKGLVGETDSGYIAAVGGPTPEVTALVNSINSQRKKIYQDLAKKEGVPLSEVEKVAAQKAINKTPAGQKVRIGGAWQTK